MRVVRAGQDVTGLPEVDEALEIAALELRPLIADDPWAGLRMGLAGLLDDDLGVSLPHGRTDVPGQHAAGTAIEHSAEEVKGAADVQVAAEIMDTH